MRLFVYEYTCAEPLADGPELASLRTEGRAMLNALLADVRASAGVEVYTILAESLAPGGGELAFDDAVRTADAVILIAPEFDDLLLSRCRRVEELGVSLLSPSAAAVRLTADKLAIGEHLRRHGVPTPPCQLWRTGLDLTGLTFPAVCKPRHGAGSQATHRLANADELLQRAAEGLPWPDDLLVQPLVEGQAASVAFLCGPRQQVALLPAEQVLSDDGRFQYLGGRVPLPAALGVRAVRLAASAVRAVAGLRGYVGVDLVLGGATDGSGDCVIEINPRLTTSYLGLRAVAAENLSVALLAVARGEERPPLRWRPGAVRFWPDGRVEGRG